MRIYVAGPLTAADALDGGVQWPATAPACTWSGCDQRPFCMH